MVHIDNADLQEEHQLSTRLWHSKGVGKGTRGRGEVFPPPGVGGQWARAYLATSAAGAARAGSAVFACWACGSEPNKTKVICADLLDFILI